MEEFHLQPENLVQLERQVSEASLPKPKPEYAWYCCVLWESSILRKLEQHRTKWSNQRYSTLGIAKKLSQVVVDNNPEMDWQKPFKLLQLVGKNYHQDDDSLIIRVAEFSTANNSHIPVHERQYDLVLNHCQEYICLAEEITRLPRLLTIIMIWNFQVDHVEHLLLDIPHSGEQITGKIFLTESQVESVPSILIFHGEQLKRSRIYEIQGVFYNSELEHFDKPGIQRTTRCKMLAKEDDQNRFAVHFSRAYRIKEGPAPELYIEYSTEEEEEGTENPQITGLVEDLQVQVPQEAPNTEVEGLLPAKKEEEVDDVKNGSVVTNCKNSDSDSELGLLFSNELEDNSSTTPSGGDPELALENSSDGDSERTFSRCIKQLSQDIQFTSHRQGDLG